MENGSTFLRLSPRVVKKTAGSSANNTTAEHWVLKRVVILPHSFGVMSLVVHKGVYPGLSAGGLVVHTSTVDTW